MKKIAYKLSLLLLFSLVFLGIQDLCRKQTKGFSLIKARSAYDTCGDLALDSEDLEEMRSILSKPFHFMDKGLQCYVFVSNDDKYVLKLLRWKEIEPPLWSKYLPASWTASMREKKNAKKNHDFTSYQIAFEELKEETGLIYLHLHKTQGLDSELRLYDAIGVEHLVPSDQIEFILQKKADLFLPYFAAHKHDEVEMKKFFSSFVKLVNKRIEKKITDSDISLEYNTGICHGKPILFDIGNLSRMKETSSSSQEALQRETKLAISWLKEHSPELAPLLQEEIEQYISFKEDF